jgi:hypothetical protein
LTTSRTLLKTFGEKASNKNARQILKNPGNFQNRVFSGNPPILEKWQQKPLKFLRSRFAFATKKSFYVTLPPTQLCNGNKTLFFSNCNNIA